LRGCTPPAGIRSANELEYGAAQRSTDAEKGSVGRAQLSP